MSVPWPVRSRLRGAAFELTVTATAVVLAGIPMVEGLRVVDSGRIEVELTPEQVDAFGLQSGVAYRVRGEWYGADGRAAEMPVAVAIRVPARWLQPLGES
ncbi:hypothetical protein HS041_28125 [Planomonospora sp. ID67723]|uniref:hypothetical protein n=1 Tax=Planomonospora sp. ID67723 TaxID=2738134 RepID=UPI0018C39C0C|nr:hypothetical protein [Planomonospora sp. ID67723]MBG0831603.1 hypothetical protein [Planomonospora sp. ID67723]